MAPQYEPSYEPTSVFRLVTFTWRERTGRDLAVLHVSSRSWNPRGEKQDFLPLAFFCAFLPGRCQPSFPIHRDGREASRGGSTRQDTSGRVQTRYGRTSKPRPSPTPEVV